MDANKMNNSDKSSKSKETIIHIAVIVFFIIVIGYLSYSLIRGNDTILDSQQETVDIEVYFSNLEVQRGEKNCSTVYPTMRTISKTDKLAETALAKLFEGTTTKEGGQGLHTDISPEFTIKRLTVSEGIATVELHDDLELLGHSACEAATIKAQITKTLEQFPNINKVVITVNEKTSDL